MNPITFHFEISSKVRPDGRNDIFLRLTYDKKMKRISTKVYAKKSDFNSRAKFGNWIRSIDLSHATKNKQLKGIINQAEQASNEIEKNGLIPSLESVSNYLKGNGTGMKDSFLLYAEKIKDNFKEAGQVGSYKKYNNFINHFKAYIKSDSIRFSDITVPFINDFELHFKKMGLAVNTIEKELKILRAILYRAINDGVFPQERNPFFRIHLKTAKTNKEKLTHEEIKKIEGLKLVEGSPLWHTRNYFIFSFYCAGVRFADFCQLTWRNIEDGRLVYKMGKTGLTKSILLFPQALSILSFYEKDKKRDEDFIFPLLDTKFKYSDKFFLFNKISSKNAIVNKNLKKIANLIKLKKVLSFHISRHSFSDVARKKGMSIFDISHALGHSSIKITERYISSLDKESLDSAMSKVFE